MTKYILLTIAVVSMLFLMDGNRDLFKGECEKRGAIYITNCPQQ